MPPSGIRRRVAQVLWWVSLLILASGLALPPLGIPAPLGLLIGTGMVTLGLSALLAGEIVAGPEPRSYTVRGQVVRGRLDGRVGMCDLEVSACPNDRVASLRFGPFGKPGFEIVEGVAYLRLRNGLFRPNLTRWQSDLAGNVLWDIDVRSSLGEVALDLSNLRLERVNASTALGRLSVRCPRRGYVQMRLRSLLGTIELIIPPQVGARVTLRRGQLAHVTLNNERLLAIGGGRYSTPDFDTAPAQVEIRIESSAGDIFLN